MRVRQQLFFFHIVSDCSVVNFSNITYGLVHFFSAIKGKYFMVSAATSTASNIARTWRLKPRVFQLVDKGNRTRDRRDRRLRFCYWGSMLCRWKHVQFRSTKWPMHTKSNKAGEDDFQIPAPWGWTNNNKYVFIKWRIICTPLIERVNKWYRRLRTQNSGNSFNQLNRSEW